MYIYEIEIFATSCYINKYKIIKETNKQYKGKDHYGFVRVFPKQNIGVVLENRYNFRVFSTSLDECKKLSIEHLQELIAKVNDYKE